MQERAPDPGRLKEDAELISQATHPSVSWDLDFTALSNAQKGRKEALKVGREAIEVVTNHMKRHANQYGTSAYVFVPTSNSRRRLYKGQSERHNGYEMQEIKNSPGLHRLVKAPALSSDIALGLASTSPLGALLFANTEEGQEFLQPEEKTASGRKPVDFIRQTVDR